MSKVETRFFTTEGHGGWTVDDSSKFIRVPTSGLFFLSLRRQGSPPTKQEEYGVVCPVSGSSVGGGGGGERELDGLGPVLRSRYLDDQDSRLSGREPSSRVVYTVPLQRCLITEDTTLSSSSTVLVPSLPCFGSLGNPPRVPVSERKGQRPEVLVLQTPRRFRGRSQSGESLVDHYVSSEIN